MAIEHWQEKATELDLLHFIDNVDLNNSKHTKRLCEKFNTDGNDGETINQQTADLLGFVTRNQKDPLVVHKRQKNVVGMDKESLLMEHMKSCQRGAPQMSPCPAQIHSDEDIAVHLQNRQTSMSNFTEAVGTNPLEETP